MMGWRALEERSKPAIQNACQPLNINTNNYLTHTKARVQLAFRVSASCKLATAVRNAGTAGKRSARMSVLLDANWRGTAVPKQIAHSDASG